MGEWPGHDSVEPEAGADGFVPHHDASQVQADRVSDFPSGFSYHSGRPPIETHDRQEAQGKAQTKEASGR